MILLFYAVLFIAAIRLLLLWIKNLRENRMDEKKEKEKISTKMDLVLFWEIIERSVNASGKNRSIESLKTELRTLPPAQIVEFENRFHWLKNKLYRWDLWGAVYLLCGGCSDDSFDYFRAWLIAQGKDKFDLVMANPESIKDFVSSTDQWEGWGYCAQEVYKEKTKKSFIPSDTKTKEEPTGKEWEEDELPQLFPEIWKVVK